MWVNDEDDFLKIYFTFAKYVRQEVVSTIVQRMSEPVILLTVA